MRGQQQLYNDLIPSKLPESSGEKSKRNTFTDERDAAMVHRYYYHAHLLRRNYQDCLYHLNLEFFLSHNAIIQLLVQRTDLIKELIKANLTPADLKRRYGHFNWGLGG